MHSMVHWMFTLMSAGVEETQNGRAADRMRRDRRLCRVIAINRLI